MDCTAYGVPPPKITWLRFDPALDNPPLTELTTPANYATTAGVALWQILAHNNSLKFRPFSASDYNPAVHKAAYVCRASSESGIILSRIVNVKSGEEKPKVCKYLLNLKLQWAYLSKPLENPVRMPHTKKRFFALLSKIIYRPLVALTDFDSQANSLDGNKKGNGWSICGCSALYISAICRCKIQARS